MLNLCKSQFRDSLVAQTVRNPPAIWETWVQFLGWEDLLEKEMATHSSILAWKIPWTEEPGTQPSERHHLTLPQPPSLQHTILPLPGLSEQITSTNIP